MSQPPAAKPQAQPSPGDRPSRRARDPLALSGTIIALAFLVAFVGLPIGVMFVETVIFDGRVDLSPWERLMARGTDAIQLEHSLLLGVGVMALATFLGTGHALLTHRTNLPGGSWLGPLGAFPLVTPPILLAMSFTDIAPDAVAAMSRMVVDAGTYLPFVGDDMSRLAAAWHAQPPQVDVAGYWVMVLLLGVSLAPFPAVLTARGLRAVDGRQYESALLARGRWRAELWLLRTVAPEIAAGALFAFLLAVANHGVPEFLTVKGGNWFTYAEGVFGRWKNRAQIGDHVAVSSATVAAVPLVILTTAMLAVALRLRARGTSLTGDFRPLPVRNLGTARFLALPLPLFYLGFGLALPFGVMSAWAAGSTRNEPMTWERFGDSFRGAAFRAAGDLGNTLVIGGLVVVVVLAIAIPLARQAARGQRWAEWLPILGISVPAVLIGIGLVAAYNQPWLQRFYSGRGLVTVGYAARFLPFAVLTLAATARRIPPSVGEAAELTGRSSIARAIHVHAPLWRGACWSAACLVFILALRELDLAVTMPGGNDTVVRRLSNIVHFGGEEEGGALAVLLLGAAVLPPLLSVLITGRKIRSLS